MSASAELPAAEPGQPCTAASFDGSGCRGTVTDGQCSEQDDHHPTPGMVPYDGPGAAAGTPLAGPIGAEPPGAAWSPDTGLIYRLFGSEWLPLDVVSNGEPVDGAHLVGYRGAEEPEPATGGRS